MMNGMKFAARYYEMQYLASFNWQKIATFAIHSLK